MATNQYFNTISFAPEQSLTENLVAESIQIHGQDMYYLKRTDVNEDTVFNESTITEFNDAFSIEMYIEDADGFQGEGDFLSKFGLEIRDQLNLIVSIKRWEEESTMQYPQEGDLVYWPLQDKVYEIKFVEDEVAFWQLGKRYVYRLSTESFEFSSEKFNTGIDEIDDIQQQTFVTVDLTLGTGTGEFTVGEIVYQGTNFDSATATGTVETWNSGTKVLKLSNLTGSFAQNTNTIGRDSGANYLLGATQQIVYTENKTTDTTDGTSGQDTVFTGSSSNVEKVIDFTVGNPFSEDY